MGVVKDSRIFQNSKFAMSLQFLKKKKKKNLRDENDFLLADKH